MARGIRLDIAAETLRFTDFIEGCPPERNRSRYVRARVEVDLGDDDTIEAWTCFFARRIVPPPDVEPKSGVPSGGCEIVDPPRARQRRHRPPLAPELENWSNGLPWFKRTRRRGARPDYFW